MSEQERTLERIGRAGRRMVAADRERIAALNEASSALRDVGDMPLDELAACTGLHRMTLDALLARGPVRSSRH